MDYPELINKKVFNSFNDIAQQLALWKSKGKTVVFTNGCFDILHFGHVDYLSKAASLGDILIIGLNSDASVKQIKGPDRPIQNEQARSYILASMQFVSAVVLFNDDTPYELIKFVQPNILVKGSDYKPEDIVGADIVLEKNGEIKTIDFVDGYSTTNIINLLKT